MAVFIDTGIFVAGRNESDANHLRGRELLRTALSGSFGRILTSDYIVDESVTLALVRTRNPHIAVNVGRLIIDSPRIEKLVVTREDFDEAWEKFQKMKRKLLSFTDCTTLVLSEKRGISKIMSFDSHFDGFMERIH